MNTLVSLPDERDPHKQFELFIPKLITHIPGHFPEGFPADYPATVTDVFARDILELSEKIQDTFRVYIDLPAFLDTEYPWIPYTLALHAIILAPQCSVYFRGMDPVAYSKNIDAKRPWKPLGCIVNFVAYLCTKKGDRPLRVFEQIPSGIYASFECRIMDKIGRTGRFLPYYRSWILDPYQINAHGHSEVVYMTHPFDHLPVKNLTPELRTSFLTKAQLKKYGIVNPDIEKAVLLHDQIGTVTLRPYWRIP